MINLLTNREKEVLKLFYFNNESMADKLFVTVSTIKAHIRSILTKLKCSSKIQALIIALKNNVITCEQIVLPNEENRC